MSLDLNRSTSNLELNLSIEYVGFCKLCISSDEIKPSLNAFLNVCRTYCPIFIPFFVDLLVTFLLLEINLFSLLPKTEVIFSLREYNSNNLIVLKNNSDVSF